MNRTLRCVIGALSWIACCTVTLGQSTPDATQVDPPAKWLGVWKGEVTAENPHTDPVIFSMELEIAEQSDHRSPQMENHLRWQTRQKRTEL